MRAWGLEIHLWQILLNQKAERSLLPAESVAINVLLPEPLRSAEESKHGPSHPSVSSHARGGRATSAARAALPQAPVPMPPCPPTPHASPPTPRCKPLPGRTGLDALLQVFAATSPVAYGGDKSNMLEAKSEQTCFPPTKPSCFSRHVPVLGTLPCSFQHFEISF